MKFIYPGFLYALFAIAIPVLIHLFNFRKFKKVYFTNVRFLKEIKQDTQARSKLKHFLVLLTRISAVAFLVFAFAQPYIPNQNQSVITGNKTVSIYIDNSFSMEAVGKNGVLFDEAKRKAKEIVSAYKSSDKFQLLTNDFEGKHQRVVSKEEFWELVDEIKISPSVKKISEVVSRQSEALNTEQGTSRFAYLLSDFQQSITDVEQCKNVSGVNIRFVPLASQHKNNVFIVGCRFSSPVRKSNQSVSLVVSIRNNSEETAENIPVKLFVNGKQKALGSATIEPDVTTDVVLPFTVEETGMQNGFVSINDYPVTYDDRWYFSFETAANTGVLCINGENENSFQYIKSVFSAEPYFVLKNSGVNQVDYSSFGSCRLIILNELKTISSGLGEELKKFIGKGGSVVMFPHPDLEMQSCQQFMQLLSNQEKSGTNIQKFFINSYSRLNTMENKVAKMDVQNELFQDVFEKIPENMDFPVVKKYFSMTENSRTAEEKILQLQNGESFLSKYTVGKGKLFLFSVPLNTDFGNFAKHALFVPVMYGITLSSTGNAPLAYTVGKDDVIECDNTNVTADDVFHIKKTGGLQSSSNKTENVFSVIPEHKLMNSRTVLLTHNQIKEDGNYTLENNQKTTGISFNYDRKESVLQYFSAEELKDLIEKNNRSNIHLLDISDKDFSTSLAELNKGTQYWKICILLVLLFLGVETLLLRLWK